MWCSIRTENISWADRVKNGGVLQSPGGDEYPTQKSHLALNLRLKHVIEVNTEGRTEVTKRRGKSDKELVDDVTF
jgi:hypothetical protein